MKTRRIGTWAATVNTITWWVGIEKAQTREVIDVLADFIRCMNADETLLIPGLGTFRRVTRKARRVRNPATGELMMLPASSTIAFRAAKAVRG